MRITEKIEIPESELREIYIKGSGPGGQNINKVSSAVQLRYALADSNALPPEAKARILHQHSNHVNLAGDLIIEAHQFRTQAQNRSAARRKLLGLIRSALRQPRVRHKTSPTPGSKRRRLDQKKKHAQKKSLRRKVDLD